MGDAASLPPTSARYREVRWSMCPISLKHLRHCSKGAKLPEVSGVGMFASIPHSAQVSLNEQEAITLEKAIAQSSALSFCEAESSEWGLQSTRLMNPLANGGLAPTEGNAGRQGQAGPW